MQELKRLRDNWKNQEGLEYHILSDMSVQESIQLWLELQQAFEWQLQETEYLFAEQRRKALAELQARLYRLVE